MGRDSRSFSTTSHRLRVRCDPEAVTTSLPCPFRVPASLGPGLRTASGAKGKRGGPCHRAMMSTMSKEERTSLQSELAAALAAGKSCAEWASANGVSERTAQRWASDPEVRAEVEAYRRGNLDEAVGRMSRRAAWATDQIAELAEKARSESVRLAALRSMLSDMMAVADFAGLEQRIAKLEEQDRVRHEENASAAN
jgi:transposase